jgi:hypothetical protein
MENKTFTNIYDGVHSDPFFFLFKINPRLFFLLRDVKQVELFYIQYKSMGIE